MIRLVTLFLFALAMQTALGQGRLPFQKKRIVLKSPATYEKRIIRYDSKTGEPIYYDPKPRVVPLDVKSGKYGLRWIGYDGREKTIVYQRPDAIDAEISASVSRAATGQYIYVYNIKNLRSSGEHLSGFALQTFAANLRPIAIGDGYVGRMSNNQEMRDGNWVYFGTSNFGSTIGPGRNVELKLLSPSPPGLVECRITGGAVKMIGVGEEPPQELENVLPGYKIWPSGYTIGPVDYLKSFSPIEQAKYLLERLPQFQKLGWMTANVRGWYEQNLTGSNYERLLARANQDLRAGKVTTEFFDMIRAGK
jgi:hypothetical protein